MVGVTGGNFWASENLSGRVHFEGYPPEWRVLSKLSVQPWKAIVYLCQNESNENYFNQQVE